MGLLITGLVLWSVVHFIPSVTPNIKAEWKSKTGEKGYQGSFALLVIVALLMIVFGWRSTPPEHLYVADPAMRVVALVLMVLAFLLFGAAKAKTRIKQYIRHPQLSSVVVWGIAHLLANGETRSVVRKRPINPRGVISV